MSIIIKISRGFLKNSIFNFILKWTNLGDKIHCTKGGWEGSYSYSYTKSCYVVNQPGQSSEMLERRRYSATLTLNSTHLWITGGSSSDYLYLQTSEFVSIGQPSVKGPDLPYAVEGHCLVGVNSSTALLCGGCNTDNLNDCLYMDLEDHSWSQGPSMITKRCYHSCGIFKSAAHQGINVVIAVGGWNNDDYLDSVEILDPTTNTWNEGNILYLYFY
jgi:hypothetical protein